MTRSRAVVVSAALAGVCGVLSGGLSGCGGLAPQHEPTVVEDTAVPFGLGEPRKQVPSEASGTAEAPEYVYFVVKDRLGGVRRGLASDSPRDRVGEVLRALADGPTREEQRAGLGSVIPPDLRLRLIGLDAGTVTIDLSGDSDPSAEESPLTVAQIVLSVTSVSEIERVRLTRDRQQIPAPLVDGSLTSAPLTALDYQRLRVELSSVPGAERLTGEGSDAPESEADGSEAVPLEDPPPTPEPDPEPDVEPESGSDPETDPTSPPSSSPDGSESDGSPDSGASSV